MYSNIVSGISSKILAGIWFGILSDKHIPTSIWHLFWHGIWHSIWHSYGILSGFLSGILPNTRFCTLSDSDFDLTFYVTFACQKIKQIDLTYTLTSCLSFDVALANILAVYLAFYLRISIWHSVWHFLCIPIGIFLTFYNIAFYLALCSGPGRPRELASSPQGSCAAHHWVRVSCAPAHTELASSPYRSSPATPEGPGESCVCVNHLNRCKTSTLIGGIAFPYQVLCHEYFTRRLSNLLFVCRGCQGSLQVWH